MCIERPSYSVVPGALLLKSTDTPIAKISQDIGYATLSSFYRIFSATYACAPAAYRAKHRTA